MYKNVGAGASIGLLLLNAVGAWTTWDYSESQPEQFKAIKVGAGLVATSFLAATAVFHYENRQQTRASHPRPDNHVINSILQQNKFVATNATFACLGVVAELLILGIYAEKHQDANHNVTWSADLIKAVVITGMLSVTTAASAALSFAIDYTTQNVASAGTTAEPGRDDDYHRMAAPLSLV
ncbi:MAG: hypothetical protein P1U40_08040 [Coxiellaceae bacterium]|nr:hypothetical protein [Coxiellaceae bacterium]